ncbi:MAG: restriction endonuclease [Moraxellaceae bacterium]|nr:restriction endonuclease [Moraxellaceae bacterium]
MFQEKISDYFEGVSAKYLSAVDARPEKSNQHEIGGLVKAGFDRFLGRPPKNTVTTFKARMAFLRDEDETPIVCEDDVSWYDSRHERRGPEYRLYYKSNDVTNAISEGDFFLIGKLQNGSLLLVFAPAGSTTEFQLRAIFGIESVTDKFQTATLDASSLLLPLRLILEDIGLVFTKNTEDDDVWLGRIHSRFGESGFPATADFSAFSRETITQDTDPLTAPDDTIINWMSHEERLFRILERHIVRNRLLQGFGEKGDDVDVFVTFSLSVQNRRKSRVGRAFENHLACIFSDNKVHFEQGSTKNVTENNSKPDFLFPGFSDYRNPAYPESSLRLLGAKTTCKDRWRQVLAEGARVPSKHLVTMEAAISESQTSEMKASGLNLIVPSPIQPTYTKNQQAWLLSLADFIDEIKYLQKK